MHLNARAIAFYLPQFHPIPENDEWWGAGFTEWTNVTRATPQFKGHHQPNLPGELGFYDLRVPEVREKQAELAREHGIEGFCYWHYWLGGGRRLLELPFDQMLSSKSPDFPFCLAWANHDWKGNFFGAGTRILATQDYPGIQDHRDHFDLVLPAFRDPRYIRVDGKPLFYVYLAGQIPDCREFVDLWQKLAAESGLEGLHLVAEGLPLDKARELGFDAVSKVFHRRIGLRSPQRHGPFVNLLSRFLNKLPAGIGPRIPSPIQRYSYREAISEMLDDTYDDNEYPTVVSNWDTTPRYQRNAVMLEDPDPEVFRIHVREAIGKVSTRDRESRIVFVKSWNEWAEGNYMEPDQRYGRSRLEVFRDEIARSIS